MDKFHMTYKRILVIVDLSIHSRYLAVRGSLLAKQQLATLALLCIPQKEHYFYNEFLNLVFNYSIQKTNECQQRLKALGQDLPWPVSHHLVRNDALEKAVNQVVKEYQIDLLICGHQKTMLQPLAWRAKKLLQHTSVDLLFLPVPNHPPEQRSRSTSLSFSTNYAC